MAKTITVDGVEYIEKEEGSKLYPKIVFKTNDVLMDKCKTIGIDKVKLRGDWVRTTLTVSLLKKIIKAIETLEIEKVDIVFTEGYPTIFGKVDEKGEEIAGIILAPCKP